MNQSHKFPAVRVGMFPKDTNASGTNIFGGVILSHMDIAGAIAAREVTDHRVFTVSFDKVVFKKPVHIGDVLTCWSEVTRIGTTSITTRIVVEAQRKGVFIPVTEGEAVYVAVDDQGRPTPVKESGDSLHDNAEQVAERMNARGKMAVRKSQTPARALTRTRKKVTEFTLESPHCPAIRIGMLPKDTSVTGTNIFAGVILSHMDTAAGIAAREVTNNRVVTVSFDKVVFKQPVHVGDVLTCWSEVVKVGRTSIRTRIVVAAQRKGVFIPVTEGEAVFVSVDADGKPIPVRSEEKSIAPISNCGATCIPGAGSSSPKKRKRQSRTGKTKKKKA